MHNTQLIVSPPSHVIYICPPHQGIFRKEWLIINMYLPPCMQARSVAFLTGLIWLIY